MGIHYAVDSYLHQMRSYGIPDHRNGSYPRHLLTELAELELRIPCTRTFSPSSLLKSCAGRMFPMERLILLVFLLGLSTRRVGYALASSTPITLRILSHP